MNESKDLHDEMRFVVRLFCENYPDKYWRELDNLEAYPTEVVQAMTESGYLAALIPQTYVVFGFARERDIDHEFCESHLYQIAPISTNLILSYLTQHVLPMPHSFQI